MKLAALCCTFYRPHLLGQLIESFRRQDYPPPLRELIILDDAGQYSNQEGENWRIISIPRRFRSLGEKRNAAAALASPDVEGFLVADDDDIYLPHWFKTQAEALRRADWSRPSLVLIEEGDALKEHETGGLYHGGWAFRKEAFYRVRGYGPHNNGEDQELAGRLNSAGTTQCDPCTLASTFYIYRVHNESYHLSYMDDKGYQALGNKKTEKATVQPAWPRDYAKLPVVRRYAFASQVNPQNGKLPVELIGPVTAAGRDGPTNGMYALQKALRRRIEQGLDWLSIRSLPVSRGALPWFWHWGDRGYAVWWNSEGLPFVQGPNMLFTYSGQPRIDREECGLLDAANCRAMFCHTPWYRELIAKHRGSANQSPIQLWPYPIDPWPGEPLPDKYDLLIYAKNGNRPQLLEHLAEKFPRHIQIHYGKYRREELFEAARRSRACAYLADDDHGPLALQEILLAGCPTVGVRTGASFVEPGRTGITVPRLPPGRQCVNSDQDAADLASYCRAIQEAQSMSRTTVREIAVDSFHTERVVERVLKFLESARSIPGAESASTARTSYESANERKAKLASDGRPDGWFTDEDAIAYRAVAERLPPQGTLVEVGSWVGRSASYVLPTIVARQGRLVCVDNWRPVPNTELIKLVQNGFRPRDHFLANLKHLGFPVQSDLSATGAVLLEASSVEAAQRFPDASLDGVFIDADHSYEAVSRDLRAWLPKIKPGGYLLGHDYSPNWPGVGKAVDEILGDPDMVTGYTFGFRVYPPKPRSLRLLIGVLACRRLRARRGACSETWLDDAISRPDVDAVFLIGDQNRSTAQRVSRCLFVPCPDDYGNLVRKMQAFCRWAVDHCEFDFLFKCDDDTYVHLPRLLNAMNSAADYQGHCLNGYASGGAGYFLSRRAAELIARSTIPAPGPEDRTIAQLLLQHQIHLTSDARFHLTHDQWPTPTNQVITSHHITPERMAALHQENRPFQ